MPATFSHLNDPILNDQIGRLKSRRFLAYLEDDVTSYTIDTPNNSGTLNHCVSFHLIGRGMASSTTKGEDETMCFPISPCHAHPLGRKSLVPTPPLPFNGLYAYTRNPKRVIEVSRVESASQLDVHCQLSAEDSSLLENGMLNDHGRALRGGGGLPRDFEDPLMCYWLEQIKVLRDLFAEVPPMAYESDEAYAAAREELMDPLWEPYESERSWQPKVQVWLDPSQVEVEALVEPVEKYVEELERMYR